MRTIFYYLGISALFTHELDAVANMEWRLLYHLRTLPNVSASALFIGLHLPFFFLFFYLGHHANEKIREGFRLAISLFLIVHAGLHFRLSSHELYQFDGFASNFYIYASALCGLVFIGLHWKNRQVKASKLD